MKTNYSISRKDFNKLFTLVTGCEAETINPKYIHLNDDEFNDLLDSDVQDITIPMTDDELLNQLNESYDNEFKINETPTGKVEPSDKAYMIDMLRNIISTNEKA